MSRNASIAPVRVSGGKSVPPGGAVSAALALLFLLIALLLLTSTVATTAAALAVLGAILVGGIGFAGLRQPRETSCAVIVELPHDVSPDRARTVLLSALEGVDGIRDPERSLCRIAALKVSATVFEVACFLEEGAIASDVQSRVLTRLWHARQRELSRDTDDATSVLDALDATPLFVSLPGEIKAEMAADAEIEFWNAGEEVVKQDAPADSCFIVRRGRLGVHVTNGTHEVQVATLSTGDLFGEMSLLTGEARWATVRTDEDSELVRIRASALKTALKRSPELVQLLAETVATRREAVQEARATLEQQQPLPDAIRSFMRIESE
jgi:CRP-like cAMP-binding protein